MFRILARLWYASLNSQDAGANMKKTVAFLVCLLASASLLMTSALPVGVSQKIFTVSVPNDYRTPEPYKAEFVVPDGTMAFNFTVWGAARPWGITDMSGGKNKEIYSSRDSGRSSGMPTGDAESSEKSANPSGGETGFDPLSTISLDPGTYIIWTEEGPGRSITLQYLLQTIR
jgi:hypothetical protein